MVTVCRVEASRVGGTGSCGAGSGAVGNIRGGAEGEGKTC